MPQLGTSVFVLFSSAFSDAADTPVGAPTSNFAGIAIVSHTPDPSRGTWQYLTSPGVWTALGVATSGAAITLVAADQLRFVPAADYSGPATPLSAHLIETGPNIISGGTIILSGAGAIGGSSPYSAGTVALSLTVTEVPEGNRAPVLEPVFDPPPYNDTVARDFFDPAAGILSASDRDEEDSVIYGIEDGQSISGTFINDVFYDFARTQGYGTLYLNTRTTAGTFTFRRPATSMP